MAETVVSVSIADQRISGQPVKQDNGGFSLLHLSDDLCASISSLFFFRLSQFYGGAARMRGRAVCGYPRFCRLWLYS